MDDREQLRKLILEKSYREGEFTLSSGRTSNFYIDGKQTTLSAQGAYLCGRLLYRLICEETAKPTHAVGGMTLGADPLVTAVSLTSYLATMPLEAFIVRKEAKGHGTGKFLEGRANLPAGCCVALVEDVVTSGATLLKVIDIVEREGFIVGPVVAVLDREEGGVEALANRGYPLKTIFTRTTLLNP